MKNKLSKIKHLKTSELAIILAITHSIFSYFYSSSFFSFDPNNILEKRNRLLIDIILPIFLFFIYWGIIKAIRTQKAHQYIKRTLIYFAILMILLFLVWPGVWRHDDMTVAFYAQHYAIEGWQHVLTSIFYMLSFRIIPIFSGVIIIQCALISVITSYLYTELATKLKLKKILPKIILWIPFFLPPILDNALYPLRPILFSYVLILTIYLIIKFLSQKRVTNQQLAFTTFLLIIDCTWRSEGIYMVLVAIICFFILFKKHKVSLKPILLSSFIVLGGFLSVRSLQSSISSQHDQNRYQLSSTVEVLAPLVREAANNDENQEILSDIDKVISVDTIIDNPTIRGEYIFWTKDAVREDFSDQDYKNYLNSFIKLCLKYPKVALKNRLVEFAATSALIPNESNTIRDTSYYDNLPEDKTATYFIEHGGTLMHPWNSKLRTIIIRILEGRTLEDYYHTTPLYLIFWNLIIPFLGILAIIIYLLAKRRFVETFVIATILIKSVIVFITAPGQYHMYYYAEYLLGYIAISYLIIKILQRRSKSLHK